MSTVRHGYNWLLDDLLQPVENVNKPQYENSVLVKSGHFTKSTLHTGLTQIIITFMTTKGFDIMRHE